MEDTGFDWKILGRHVQEVVYIAWVRNQDAYGCNRVLFCQCLLGGHHGARCCCCSYHSSAWGQAEF
jgi:hypothetical protein